MRTSRPVLAPASLLLLSVAFAGCGGSTDSAVATAPAIGPHGNPVIALPDAAGFGEVLLEPAGTGAAARSSKVRVAAYFFDADLQPLPDGAVSDVTVQVNLPDGGKAPATLAADPKTPGRFGSEPGDFAVEPLSGELAARVSGQAVTVPFANPR